MSEASENAAEVFFTWVCPHEGSHSLAIKCFEYFLGLPQAAIFMPDEIAERAKEFLPVDPAVA